MRVQGVKVDGIALFQNQLFILEEYLYFPFQYQIEFLAAVSNQSGLFIIWHQPNPKGLHDFMSKTESQILEIVARDSLNGKAFALFHNLIGIQAGIVSGEDFGEIHAAQVGDLIDHADRDIVSILLIRAQYGYVNPQLLCQFFLRVAAGPAQFPDSGGDLRALFHYVHPFSLFSFNQLKVLSILVFFVLNY